MATEGIPNSRSRSPWIKNSSASVTAQLFAFSKGLAYKENIQHDIPKAAYSIVNTNTVTNIGTFHDDAA